MSEEKLRILCFHGYRQTGIIFREKTGSLRKALKKQADLTYLTAPLIVPALEGTEQGDGGRGWWFSRKDDYFKARDPSDCIKGFEDSLKMTEEFVENEGPFDGLLGFSQGGGFVSLLCSLQQQKRLAFSFKFAIIIAGFKSRSTPHNDFYLEKIGLPSLHVYGATDQVIEKDMSEELLQYFKDPSTIEHEGGHFVPASSHQKTEYIKFLTDFKNSTR